MRHGNIVPENVTADKAAEFDSNKKLIGTRDISSSGTGNADDLLDRTGVAAVAGGGPPAAHVSTHAFGGSDQLNVSGLSGVLADDQNPTTHASSHQNGGSDEISVAGLSGTLADAQTPTSHASTHTDGTDDIQDASGSQKGLLTNAAQTIGGVKTFNSFPITPSAAPTTNYQTANKKYVDDSISGSIPSHATSHQNGGSDEINVAGLSGVLADPQTAASHGSTHTNGTDDIQDASGSQKGLLTNAAQTIGGVKTFSDFPVTPSSSPTTSYQVANKDYVDTRTAGLLDYKSGYNANTNVPDLDVSPSGILKGDCYTVTSDGVFFTEQVRTGDFLIAEVDNASALADWTIVERNLDLATETVPGIVELATNGETAASKVVQGSDSRLAGNTKNADTSLAGNGYFLDEDNMVSDDATKVASQQSIKAFVETQVAGGETGKLDMHEFMWVRDEKTSGTAPQTTATGAYTTRDLNTEKRNTITGASVNTSTGVVTLPAGTYYVTGSCPADRSSLQKARLYNSSDSTAIEVGQSAEQYTNGQGGTPAVVEAYFTLASQKNIVLQHHIAAGAFGQAVSFGDVEVYSDLKIWKVG